MAAEHAPKAMAASPPPSVDIKPAPIHRPSLVMKPPPAMPATSPTATSPTPPMSLTSKEWIVPPRPKPGRKPATDTPPSKRKAQNRAAQRAFRERRAARVNELEDQIKIIDDENEKEQESLRVRVIQLEREAEQYRADLVVWVDRCRRLENEINHLNSVASGSKSSTIPEPTAEEVGCGKCTLETRCQCIDDAFDALTGEQANVVVSDKRVRSPSSTHINKRVKTEANDNLEVDFTAMFAKQPARAQQLSPTTVADPCGFCSDGTPCICAEMAAEQEHGQSSIMARSIQGRGDISHHLSTLTPPPSEGDVVASQPCVNGPGTCAQCRSDPNSTAFCKSLAASRAQIPDAQPQGCCGGRTADGGCCSSTEAVPLPSRKTRSRTAAATSSTRSDAQQKPIITLTCADAYTTLSRHPAYSRATGEIATWLPKLHASDAPVSERTGSQTVQGRPAMEIDAANVMAVLKDFDRRFGRNA